MEILNDSWSELGSDKEMGVLCNKLVASFLYLEEILPDSIVWVKIGASGDYSVRCGYDIDVSESFRGSKEWWVFAVWKSSRALKEKNVLRQ